MPDQAGSQTVLLEKGLPQIAIDPAQNPRADSKAAPLDCSKFNAVIVDVIAAGTNTLPTTISVLGSPFATEPWLLEWDPNAIQNVPAGTNKRFLVVGVSSWVAVALTQAIGWRVVLTPLDAPAQTVINVAGTSNINLNQVGGLAIGPANPVPVSLPGALDVSDRAARLVGHVTVDALPAISPVRGNKTFTSFNATNANALLATTATRILAANAARKGALIQNLGGVDITIGKDNTVDASHGIRLPGGLTPPAQLSDASSQDDWWAFAAAAGSDIRVVETA